LANGDTLIFGYIDDITDRRRVEAALQSELEITRFAINSVGDAVISLSAAGLITSMNPAAERLTGWRLAEVVGWNIDQVVQLWDREFAHAIANPAFTCLGEQRIVELGSTVQLRSRDGVESLVEVSAAPIHADSAATAAVILVLQDVTQREQMSTEATARSKTDALTGLSSRAAMESELDSLMRSALVNANTSTFLTVDLDQFKIINETLGYATGDHLLAETGRLLRQFAADRGPVARLSGDRFGILMRNCTDDVVNEEANRLQHLLHDHAFEGVGIKVSASIGVVRLSDFTTPAQVFSAADSACASAKVTGRGQVHRFVATLEDATAQRNEMRLATKVATAIEDNTLCLYAQTIRPLNGADRGLHFEVLLRLRDPETQSFIPPGQFMQAAERYGLAPDVDHWVANATLDWLAAQPHNITSRISTIAINLSGVSVGNPQFGSFLTDLLDHHPSFAHLLCFEITETAAVGSLHQASSLIRQLQARGATVALDDFGVGMSSLAYLKELPANYVKIDGQFVRDMASDRLDLAMVRSINDIAHLMGKQTIAEFVESQPVLALLRNLGVDYAQGYLLGRPTPIDEFVVSET
jgi:diguanylate cyclase (GGDEF)-like protein/PAS domain S-box-containing protein